MTNDPHLEVIRAFHRARIDYLVIGVSGINYFAKSTRQVIMTADFDLFLRPEPGNLLKSLRILRRLGFELSTRRGAIRRLSEAAGRIWIDQGTTIVASNYFGTSIDLCLAVSGFDYDELDRGLRRFRVGRIPIRVARLPDLIRMKEIADRPKDRLFLAKYHLILKGLDEGTGKEEEEKPDRT